jgi:hypothetical protein
MTNSALLLLLVLECVSHTYRYPHHSSFHSASFVLAPSLWKMKKEARQHVMLLFLAVQAFLGAISSAMTSEDALWITALAAAAGSQPAAAWSTEVLYRGRALNSRRIFDRSPCSWFRDYHSPSPLYNATHFRRRFRIPLSLYCRIESDLWSKFP